MRNHAVTALTIAAAISTIPWATHADEQTFARFGLRARADAPPPTVRVLPAGNEWPENQARLHLEFSAPMTPGMASTHVRLLDDEGHEIEGALAMNGEEVWDSDRRRLTLALRPALQAGRPYSVAVDAGWLDARGQQLVARVTHHFTTVRADRAVPNPDEWRLAPPALGSNDAVHLSFPEPLDYALLRHAVSVVDADGVMVEGSVEIGRGEREWRFVPLRAWTAGKYSLVIDPRLEDAAGNNLLRLVDAPDTAGLPYCPVQVNFWPVLRT